MTLLQINVTDEELAYIRDAFFDNIDDPAHPHHTIPAKLLRACPQDPKVGDFVKVVHRSSQRLRTELLGWRTAHALCLEAIERLTVELDNARLLPEDGARD